MNGAMHTLYAHENNGGHLNGVCYPAAFMGGQAHGICYSIDQQGGKSMAGYAEDVSPTLLSDSHGTPHAVCFQQNQRDEVRNMGEQVGALMAQPGAHNQNYICYPEIARSLCARANSSYCVDRGQNVVVYKQTGFADYDEGIGTLRANGGDAGGQRILSLNVFENHSQDTRYNGPVNVSQTVSATFGTGGNNTPFVVEEYE